MSRQVDDAGSPGSNWHARTFEAVARELGSHPETGLPTEDLSAPSPPTTPGVSDPGRAWRILWTQLKGSVILVLLVSSVASLLLGHTSDALAILASVLFSVTFGF